MVSLGRNTSSLVGSDMLMSEKRMNHALAHASSTNAMMHMYGIEYSSTCDVSTKWKGRHFEDHADQRTGGLKGTKIVHHLDISMH